MSCAMCESDAVQLMSAVDVLVVPHSVRCTLCGTTSTQHFNKLFFVQFEYNRPTCHWNVLFQNTELHAGIHTQKDR